MRLAITQKQEKELLRRKFMPELPETHLWQIVQKRLLSQFRLPRFPQKADRPFSRDKKPKRPNFGDASFA
jgi:hypothetical protein